MDSQVYICVRLDGCLDCVVFDNAQAAEDFMVWNSEYEVFLQSSVFSNCEDVKELFYKAGV